MDPEKLAEVGAKPRHTLEVQGLSEETGEVVFKYTDEAGGVE